MGPMIDSAPGIDMARDPRTLKSVVQEDPVIWAWARAKAVCAMFERVMAFPVGLFMEISLAVRSVEGEYLSGTVNIDFVSGIPAR